MSEKKIFVYLAPSGYPGILMRQIASLDRVAYIYKQAILTE